MLLAFCRGLVNKWDRAGKGIWVTKQAKKIQNTCGIFLMDIFALPKSKVSLKGRSQKISVLIF